jgi:hypothetical protein
MVLSSTIRTLCVGVVLFEATTALDLELPFRDIAAVVGVRLLHGTTTGAGTLRLDSCGISRVLFWVGAGTVQTGLQRSSKLVWSYWMSDVLHVSARGDVF